MVSKGRGRLFRTEDPKYLIYMPKSLVEDSMFPFKNWQEDQRTGEKNTIHVKVSFTPAGGKELLIEKWKEPLAQE
jgi:hypothetical protein